MAQFFTARQPLEGSRVQIDPTSIQEIGGAAGSTGGNIETSPGGASAVLSGGDYRSITASSVYLPSGDEVCMIAIRLTDPTAKLLLNFAVIETISGNKPYVWGIGLNPTFSGTPSGPAWTAVPGSTKVEYAVGGSGTGTRVPISDRGVTIYHTNVLNLTSENNFLNAIALSSVQTGPGYTIEGTDQTLVFFAKTLGGNQNQEIQISFVEVA